MHQPNQQQDNSEEEVIKPEWFINTLQEQYLKQKLHEAIMEHAMAIYKWDENPALVAAANSCGRTRIAVLQELLEKCQVVHPNL